MAITLQQSVVSLNLSNIIDGAIVAVKAVRKQEQARYEAEFQRAVADGLSYEEQIKIREKQLEEAKTSTISDLDYISDLEKSVIDTKKLSRFNKYRTKYSTVLSELGAGKINEEQYLLTLKDTLINVDDPELRLEIQKDIATAESKVKTYRDTILDNQVKKAKYDGTQSSLNDAITRVKNARASALISDNKDEVTAYDETLAALDSQLSTTLIQDSLTNFQVNSSTRGTSPLEKLNFINDEISKANPYQPIKIGNTAYNSAQQFWQLERDGFLAGSSKIFGDFFNELQTFTKNTIDANTVKFGYPTQIVLDNVDDTFKSLSSRQELQPFVNKLDITKAASMAEAVDKFAKKVSDAAEFSMDYVSGVKQLQNVGQKYGVNTEFYTSGLLQKVRGLEQANLIAKGTAAKIAGDEISVELPEIVTPGVTPTIPSISAKPTTSSYTVKSGDTLSAIAAGAGLSLTEVIDLNPQFKTNPNLIKPGDNINLSVEPKVPEVVPEKKEMPIPTPPISTTQPAPDVSQTTPITPPKVQAPTPPEQPKPAQPSSTYTGSSIVDYLKSLGQDSSYVAREKIAKEKGITGYTGSAEQNVELLKMLKGQ